MLGSCLLPALAHRAGGAAGHSPLLGLPRATPPLKPAGDTDQEPWSPGRGSPSAAGRLLLVEGRAQGGSNTPGAAPCALRGPGLDAEAILPAAGGTGQGPEPAADWSRDPSRGHPGRELTPRGLLSPAGTRTHARRLETSWIWTWGRRRRTRRGAGTATTPRAAASRRTGACAAPGTLPCTLLARGAVTAVCSPTGCK